VTAFHYTGRDETGRFVTGTVVAPSRLEALTLLKVGSTSLTSIQSASSTIGRVGDVLGALSTDATARIVAFRSLAALVGAGIPLRQSLAVVMAECVNGRLREAIAAISAEIEQGSGLEAALRRRPREFPGEVCAMVRAGEIAGSLDDALRRIAAYVERAHALRKRISGALVYPVVVAVMALGLILFLLGSVVPAFSGMFVGMNIPLPPVTQMVLAIGAAIDNPVGWIAAILAIVVAVVSVRSAVRIEKVALGWDRLRWRIPIVGNLIRRGEVAACARTLGSLTNSGVAVETALQAARGGSSSPVVRRACDEVVEAVRLGDSVAGAFSRTGCFGSMFVAMARAGEESGTLGDMMLRVAEHEELEIESTIAMLGGALEPLLILLLGGMVGTIVAAVLIPLYSMIGSIK
jgi:type IV pilus assembly protein PilC